MRAEIRLSETSAQATAALATMNGAKLRELTERLTMVAEGKLGVETERTEVVERELRILSGVLAATEENIHVLRRLQERKARIEWAL